MRILYAAAPEIFDPAAPVAPDPDSDGPGSSPSGTSMAGWMRGMDDAPGGLPTPTPEPKEPDGKNDPARGGPDGNTPAVGSGSTATGNDLKVKLPATTEPAAEPAKGKGEPDPGKTTAVPDDETEDKWPRNAKDWDKFKAKRAEREKALKEEINTRDTRIKELEGKTTEFEQKLSSKPVVDPDVTAKLERLEAENKELTDRITVLDVTRHPKFESFYNGKIDAEIARAKRIVGDERGTQMEKILKLSDPEYRQAQLNDFLADLGTFEQSRVAVVIDNLEKINEDRESEIKKAGEHKTKLETDNKSSAETRQKMLENAFGEVIKAVQDPKKGSRVFQKLAADQDGAADWNKGVDQRIEQAKQILQSKDLPPQRITQIVLDAIAMPVIAHAFAAARKSWDEKIAKLEQQVKDMTAARPGGNGTGATKPANGGAPENVPYKQSDTPFDVSRKFAERMATWQES